MRGSSVLSLTQLAIDRAKGIIAKPMPEYWYSMRDNVVKEIDTKEVAEKKRFNQRIAAANKPYFMTYVYPNLRTQNNTYNASSEIGTLMRFYDKGIESFDDLVRYEPKDETMLTAIRLHKKVVGNNPCVVNKICWLFENTFNGFLSKKQEQPEFDYTILKCGVEYSKNSFRNVLGVYEEYKRDFDAFESKSRVDRIDPYENWQQRELFISKFRRECESICTNEKELCDIVLDLCYTTDRTKQFAWDVCGETILNNLLEKNDWVVSFPELVEGDGDFTYCGESFKMCEKFMGEEYGNNFE